MKKIATKEKIGLGLVLAMVVTNPLTGQYVNQIIDWGFQQLFLHGAWVSLVGGSYLMALLVFQIIKSYRINIPAKSAKTEKQRYLTT